MSLSMSQDVPSLTSIPIASKDVEKHCPIRAMNVATHLKTQSFRQGLQRRESLGSKFESKKYLRSRHKEYKSTKSTKWRRLGRI